MYYCTTKNPIGYNSKSSNTYCSWLIPVELASCMVPGTWFLEVAQHQLVLQHIYSYDIHV